MSDDFSTVEWTYVGEETKPATPLPQVFIGLGGLLVSALLLAVAWGLPEANFPFPAAVGFIITPLGTAVILAWALSRHRIASANSSSEIKKGRLLLRLSIAVTLAGFVLGTLLSFRLALWVAQLPLFNQGAA